MSEKYTISVEAVLNEVNLQKQLDSYSKNIAKQHSNAINNTSKDFTKLQNQVTRWQNTLDVMGKKYPAAFNTEAVQNQVVAFQGLFNAYTQGKVSRDEMITGMSNIRKEMNLARIETLEAAQNTGKFSDQIAENTKKVMQWAVATTLIYGSLRKVREGIEYISELNQAMTNIQVVTQINAEETYDLVQSYNELANALGVTTVQVAEGSTEWLRQGESIESTQELLKSTIMLAKLGNMTTAEATEYLISSLNGFNLTAEDSMGIVDELINLDNQYATSAAEIAMALQRSAASGQQAGVTFEELAAYITTVSSVTRKSASSIGESFKTMFARMQRVKIGAQFDEDGESISDVEEVLSGLNIQLRDTLGTFRPLGDVLDDINSKWSNLSTVQQSQVAEAIAGVRQRENFLVLMQNYNKVIDAQAIALDSAGLAQERYDIYLNSVEAAANRAKTAWEGMWQATISNEGIKFVYNLSAALGNFIKKIGGLIPVLTTVLSLLVGAKWATLASAITKAFAAIQAGLTTLSFSSVVGWIGLIASTIWMVVESIETADEKVERLTQEISDLKTEIDGLQESRDSFEDLWQEFQKLSENTSRTSDEQQRWLDIQNELVSILPQINGRYDAQGQFFVDVQGPYSRYIALLEREIELKQQDLALDAQERIQTQIDDYQDLSNELDKLITKREEVAVIAASKADDDPIKADMLAWLELQDQKITSKLGEMDDAILAMVADWRLLDEETQKTIWMTIRDIPVLGQSFYELLNSLSSVEEGAENTGQSLLELSDDLDEVTDTLLDHLSALESIAKTYEETGQITVQQAMKMIDMGYAEALMIDAKTGAITVNTAVLRQLAIEEARAAAADAQLAYQAAASIDAHSAETKALWAKYQALAAIQTLLENTPETSFPTISIPTYGGGGGSGSNDAASAYNDLLRKTIELLKFKKQQEKEALQEELKHYKEIIDARKEILDQQKEERSYQQDLDEKNKAIADIEAELLQMQYDNSQEANARRLKLQEELAEKTQDLEDLQYDHSVDVQKDALDEEYEQFKESIDQRIEAIDDYLSKTGLIAQQAMELIAQKAGWLYRELIEWNRLYGDGLDSTIQKLWALADANAAVGGSGGGSGSGGGGGDNKGAPKGAPEKKGSHPKLYTFHSGGFVGDTSPSTSEVFAKLLRGEYVATANDMSNFVNNVLPKIMGSSINSGNNQLSVPIKIEINGNVDKDVMKNMEDRIMKAVVKATSQRGIRRNVNSYTI